LRKRGRLPAARRAFDDRDRIAAAGGNDRFDLFRTQPDGVALVGGSL
jgi:hypothetical protein